MKKPILAFLVLVGALLKLFKLELLTARWSKEFHLLMTLSVKEYFLRSNRQWSLASLRLRSLVWLLLLTSNTESDFRTDNLVYFLKTSVRSAVFLCSSSDISWKTSKSSSQKIVTFFPNVYVRSTCDDDWFIHMSEDDFKSNHIKIKFI